MRAVNDDKVPDHPLILRNEPLGSMAEGIRRLRANLQFVDLGDRPHSIVVTSPVFGEDAADWPQRFAILAEEWADRAG